MNTKDLNLLLSKANMALESNLVPTVIFDLDDTLFDSRSRTLRILKEFASSSTIQSDIRFKLNRVNLVDIRYFLKETLKGIGIVNQDDIVQIENFWLKRFFSNQYASEDDPTPGAIKFAKFLHQNNISLFYLTGRSEKMRKGTTKSLLKNEFKLSSDAHLMMKEDFKQEDLIYKKSVADLLKLKNEIQVIAFFENQPENANQFIEIFPEAYHFLIDTIHAPSNVKLHSKIKLITSFIEAAD